MLMNLRIKKKKLCVPKTQSAYEKTIGEMMEKFA